MISAASSTWAREIAADIDAARASVQLTALSCLPPRSLKPDAFGLLWGAIAGAAARGCSVLLYLPAPSLAHPATLRNGFACEVVRALGGSCRLLPPARLLHAKTVLVDLRIAWVGSGNLTAAAAHHNREFFLRTTDPAAVAAVAGFHLDLGTAADENISKVCPTGIR